MVDSNPEHTPDAVAIVGLSGRFPAAADLTAYWNNLRAGVDSLSSFSESELREAGEDATTLADPRYVRAGRTLEGIELFDADLFGYSPREAALLDPQQRVFLEQAYAALEDAGHAPAEFAGTIGVYAGAALSTYLLAQLGDGAGPRAALEDLVVQLGNEKDFLAGRVAYHLNLSGPSLTVQSGCSSALVAVAQAFQALLGHQCDMALAGGVAIRVPQQHGYIHQPESILSPDGRCRPFDAEARGTSFGSGAGVVVLRRLSDALADGDSIRAVLLGAAVNNDGGAKLGFTAPSQVRQAEVVALAQAVAGVAAHTIDYVEAHGTGTPLGDPVEVAALRQAFQARGEPGSCILGSVKGNIGHLESASGVAGLIKTVLAFEKEELPPTLHFKTPNPACELETSPFRVLNELCPWPRGDRPRRAGVSSFGMGGTNAHVVLEEAPAIESGGAARAMQLLVLSARSSQTLETMALNLAQHLERHPALELADVAFTLQVGRQTHPYRQAVVCSDRQAALDSLRSPQAVRRCEPGHRPVSFVLQDELETLDEHWTELLGTEPFLARAFQRHDLPSMKGRAARLVLYQYALAQLYIEWGVRPERFDARGVGQLTEAVLLDRIGLEEALVLAERGPKHWAHYSNQGPNQRGPQSGSTPEALQVELDPSRSSLATRLEVLAQLWLSGVELDWRGLHRDRRPRRLPLPTYPFERRRCWIDAPRPGPSNSTERSQDPARWLYAPTWKRTIAQERHSASQARPLVVLADDDSEGFVSHLRKRGHSIIEARVGTEFRKLGTDVYSLNPARREDFESLFRAAGARGPTEVLHLWLAASGELSTDETLQRGLVALRQLALGWKAHVEQAPRRESEAPSPSALQLTVITRGVHDVTGEEVLPARATILGACRVLPQEHSGFRVRCIDIDSQLSAGACERLLDRLAREIGAPGPTLAAVRGAYLWEPAYEPAALPSPKEMRLLRRGGVYLITGGFGGIGSALAEHLASTLEAKLVLCGRRGSAGRETFVSELEARGAQVLACAADVTDRVAMREALEAARRHFGAIDGVIHAAGVRGVGLDGDGAAPQEVGSLSEALRVKLDGTLVLAELAHDANFIVLCSALATLLGGIGQAEYCAGNAFLDAFAAKAARSAASGPRVMSIGWDTWADTGMAAEARVPEALRDRQAQILRAGLGRSEGIDVFRRVLAAAHPHVLVSTIALQERIAERERAVHAPMPLERDESSVPMSVSDVEAQVHQAWIQILGLEQASPDDRFFEQGGNSLLAAQLLGRFQSEYPKADLSLRRFFEEPTIRSLVRAIDESREGSGTTPPPKQPIATGDGSAAARRGELRAYVRGELSRELGIAPEAVENLAQLDPRLVAAHLTEALQRDLDLSLYPHEIRGSSSLDELVALIDAERERLAAAPKLERLDETARTETGSAPIRRATRAAPALKNPAAAFLLSAPRSGSTLLRVMLSAHSHLFCPPELFLLDNESMRSWDQDPFAEFYRDGLVRALMALGPLDYARACRQVDDLVARDAPVGEVYALMQRPGQLLVDKTPTYARSMASLRRAEALFASPRYIFLVRHPHAAIDSFVRNRIDRVRRVEGDSHELGEQNWVRSYRNLELFAREVDRDRTYVVRYEDLVREPRSVLQGLCDFLGVAFEDALLDPYGQGKMIGGPGDPHFFRRGKIDPACGEAWRGIELPRPLGKEGMALASSFGYELPRAVR